MTHTKGPFHVAPHMRDDETMVSLNVYAADGVPFCRMGGNVSHRTEEAENAQLFAKSPDLLAAMRLLVAEAEASRRVLSDITEGKATADLAAFRLQDSYSSPSGDAIARANELLLAFPVDEQAEEAGYERHLEEREQAHYRQLEGEEREREERYADNYA